MHAIFRFRSHGGTELNPAADPIAAYYRLAEATRGWLPDLMRDRRSRNLDVCYAATEYLLPAVRHAFVGAVGFTDADCIDLLEAFIAFMDGIEERCRESADMVHTYGVDVLRLAAEAYPLYVGLWLNLTRVRLQKAMDYARGAGIVHGSDDVPRAYFEADARTSSEAAQAQFDVNAERRERRIIARGGRPK